MICPQRPSSLSRRRMRISRYARLAISAESNGDVNFLIATSWNKLLIELDCLRDATYRVVKSSAENQNNSRQTAVPQDVLGPHHLPKRAASHVLCVLEPDRQRVRGRLDLRAVERHVDRKIISALAELAALSSR